MEQEIIEKIFAWLIISILLFLSGNWGIKTFPNLITGSEIYMVYIGALFFSISCWYSLFIEKKDFE